MVSIVSILVLFIVSVVSIEGQSHLNCGGSHISVNTLQIVPHPMPRPTGSATSPVKFNINTQISQQLAEPVQVTVTLEYQLLIWIKIPCTNGVGSCTYRTLNEFCKTCANTYGPGSHQFVLEMNLTSDVRAGSYRARIEFRSATGQTGCVSITGIRAT